jgi:hypothetical protein
MPTVTPTFQKDLGAGKTSHQPEGDGEGDVDRPPVDDGIEVGDTHAAEGQPLQVPEELGGVHLEGRDQRENRA